MCGRFSLHTEPVKVARYLQAQLPGGTEDWKPSWNIPPTRKIFAARDEPGEDGKLTRTLELYRWGLVPFWAKNPAAIKSTFNARAETVATKPMFRHAFQIGKRVLIPADAFYEWKRDGAEKQPHAFRRTDGDLLVFAGLCEFWKGPEDEHSMGSCTIITTSDGPDMHEIHNRMPVILERDAWSRWLDPSLQDKDELEKMFLPAPAGTIEHYPVSNDVGKVGNDGAQLLEMSGG
ncbi:MAG TPA: SOS response-associated peptidase [Acidimicrobiales bacterium]|jgi:putative SOS response-associated peptidase YedK|nr:SOS response-associated peptidase [Acidimicrobiales bacterium]